MNCETPHLIYILGAYGVSFVGLCVFMGVTVVQWKKSRNRLTRVLKVHNGKGYSLKPE